MTRKFLELDKLLETMNKELENHDTCTDCRFSTIVPLENADETGCNWSHANLNCRSYPTTLGREPARCDPTITCQPLVARVIEDAKKIYNVR